MLQNDFGTYGELPPLEPHEEHVLVLFLLDTSGSMGENNRLESLKSGLKTCLRKIREDSLAKRRVDVCVMTFNERPRVVVDWRPVAEVPEELGLSAGGGTDISAALLEAIEHVRARGHIFDNNAVGMKVPLIIFISDGEDKRVDRAAEILRQRTEEAGGRKLQLWAFGVPGYDRETFAKISRGRRVFELMKADNEAFDEVFNFVALYSKAASASAPGAKIHLDSNIGQPELGSSCRVPNLDDWLNN